MTQLKLTDNEKETLKALIKNGRITCSEIAKDLGISPQAVCKIQDKLEGTGVIKGYTAEIDYEKMGVGVFAIACFSLKEKTPETSCEKMLMDRMKKNPFLLRVYKLPAGEDVTHMAIYGFRSIVELEYYFNVFRRLINTHMSEFVQLKSFRTISTQGVLKDDIRGFLMRITQELGKEKLAEPELDFNGLDEPGGSEAEKK